MLAEYLTLENRNMIFLIWINKVILLVIMNLRIIKDSIINNYYKIIRDLCIIITNIFILSNLTLATPKNIILLIGDGMGFPQINATSQYVYGKSGELELEKLPIRGSITTHAKNNKITDSSGNSNIGILLGDYSLSKDGKKEEMIRDKTMKTPDLDTKEGAM